MKTFVLLIGTMKMSGVSTWAVNLCAATRNAGDNITLLCMGEPGEVKVPGNIPTTYLRRPRTNPALRILRLFMINKLFPQWFKKMEWKVREYRVEQALANIHAKTPIDLIIKDFTTDAPSSIYHYPTTGVIHQLLSECWHIPIIRQHESDPYTYRVAVSKAARADAEKLGLSVNAVIHNPLPDYTPDYTPEDKNQCDNGDIVFVGNVSKMKGALRLFDAYLRSGRNNRLIYAGYGSAMKTLQTLIRQNQLEDRVQLLGYVDDTKPLISQAALLVLPSYHEAMGYSAIEALCLKTPVIVTRYAAAEEFIDPEYIVDGHSDEELCENLAVKINTVLNNTYSFEYSKQCFNKMQPAHIAAQFNKLTEES